MKPMLAESIHPKDLPRYCKDDDWAFQQKIDGHRRLVEVSEGVVTPLNRSGVRTDLPRFVTSKLSRIIGGPWVFDGELLGGVLYLFDLVQAGPLVTAETPFAERNEGLNAVASVADFDPSVRIVPTAIGQEAKGDLAKRILTHQGEGVILRHLGGTYAPGRRSRHLLKAKFRSTADCVVTGLGTNGKHNMVLAMYDGDRLVNVAECTAQAGDGPRVQVGDVVEVTYLYASADRRLVQPTYPKIRTDKHPEECTIDQLVPTNKEVLT